MSNSHGEPKEDIRPGTSAVPLDERPQKKHTWRWILIVVLLVALILMAGSCSVIYVLSDIFTDDKDSYSPNANGHIHTQESSIWQSDGQNHWYICSCGEKMSEENHVFGEWVISSSATETTKGRKDRSCTVCNYKESADIPNLVHTHKGSSSWGNNETAHWHDCNCGEKLDIAGHSFGSWNTLIMATETKTGRKERTCSTCNYKEVAEIPVLSHTHSYSSSWERNETSHWKKCKCGEKSSLSYHSYGSWITVKSATCTAVGSQKRTCASCSYSETKIISAKGHYYSGGYCTSCGAHDGVTYRVTFNANDGIVSTSSKTVTKNATYGTLPTPSRDYYNFDGWYTSASGGSKITSSTTFTASSNMTLYAHWSLKATTWALASNVPSGAQKVNEKWTYTRTQYKESTATSISGWSQTGSSYWQQIGSGSKNYSTGFPSGFDTSHSIYTSFAKSKPYSNSETSTTKRVVTDSWGGYVYWHWMYDCGGASGISTRTIFHKKGNGSDNGYYYYNFGAFTSTNGSYSGDKYYCNSQSIMNYIIPEITAYSQCQGATRWFRFEYRTCSYVDYQKVFQYKKVTDEVSYSSVSASGEISNVKHYIEYRPK